MSTRPGEGLVRAALAAGADRAQLIEGGRVQTSALFRDLCAANSCGRYGRCHMCPPGVGDIGTLMDRVKAFPWALVYQTVSPLEDGFDIEGMTAASRRHALVSKRLEDSLGQARPARMLHLTCGGCGLCERCAMEDGLPCRHPDRALPSVESYGIDVYNTVKDTALRYVNGPNTVTYFGMLLFGDDACTG